MTYKIYKKDKMRSNQATFIANELRTPQNVVSMFSRYNFRPPAYATVEKWFQRKTVPSSALFVILALIELEQGGALSLTRYVSQGEQ